VAGDVDLELPGPPPVRAEAHEHTHRDVSGGWLRPSVFGAMDGLVTNVSLIAGVGGGGVGRHTLILTGMAGLVAGAFSMATGEYTSVASQNEAVCAEVGVEARDLERHPEAEAPSWLTRSSPAGSGLRSPWQSPKTWALTRRRRCASTPARSWGSTRTSCPARGRLRRAALPSSRWGRCCRCCPTCLA